MNSAVLMTRVRAGMVALVLSGGALVAATQSANAVTVPNMMRCEPDTGWCYQTNPPVNNSVPHSCQWDYTLRNLRSGMWYTGCNSWGPAIH